MINLDNYAIPEEERSGQLKLTIAQFYRVNGQSTQLTGVSPDISLPSAFDHEDFGERAAHNPMPATSTDGLDVSQRYELEAVIDELAERHQERMAQRKGFRAFREELELKRKLRDETKVALDKEQRQEEQEAREERLLEHHNARRRAHGMEPVETYDAIDEDELPDVALQASAAVISDLGRLLRRSEGKLAEISAQEEG